MTTTIATPVIPTRESTGPERLTLGRVLIYAALLLASILFLIPVYMVLVTSFKSIDQVSISTMWQLPTSFTLDSFTRAFERLLPNLINSIMLVIPATALSAVLGSMNGYVLSKWSFRGANIVFPLMLFGMFIPYQAILIPLVQFLQGIRAVWDDTGFNPGACGVWPADHDADLPQLLRRSAHRNAGSRGD